MERLDRTTAQRVRAAILRHAETEYGDVIRLQGTSEPVFRLRGGDYCVLFHFEPPAANDRDRRESMVIERVLHRRDAYR